MGEHAGLREEILEWRTELTELLSGFCAVSGFDVKRLSLIELCALARIHNLLPTEILDDANFVRSVSGKYMDHEYDKAMRRDVGRARQCMERVRTWFSGYRRPTPSAPHAV